MRTLATLIIEVHISGWFCKRFSIIFKKFIVLQISSYVSISLWNLQSSWDKFFIEVPMVLPLYWDLLHEFFKLLYKFSYPLSIDFDLREH
jgi:hypothetical protein